MPSHPTMRGWGWGGDVLPKATWSCLSCPLVTGLGVGCPFMRYPAKHSSESEVRIGLQDTEVCLPTILSSETPVAPQSLITLLALQALSTADPCILAQKETPDPGWPHRALGEAGSVGEPIPWVLQPAGHLGLCCSRERRGGESHTIVDVALIVPWGLWWLLTPFSSVEE